MSYANNIGDAITALSLKAVGAETASTNGTGVDMAQYCGQVAFLLEAAAGTGTSPTNTVKIQHSDDNSTWVDSGYTFAQYTTSASRQKVVAVVDNLKRYVRSVSTIGGTTPSFTYAVVAISAAKYPS